MRNPRTLCTSLLLKYGGWIPDKVYLKFLFRLKMGYRLNLKSPKTFSEKLQWLKLYDRKPEYTSMVDKYAVKEYVANIIGEEYVIPTLGVWNTPNEIEWEKLPNQFVLKTTHGGGSVGVVVCKNKNLFDKEVAVRKLEQSMKQDIYKALREWPYKNVTRRIIAEKLLEPTFPKKELLDYKFFCFNGEPHFCQVITGREEKMCVDFFDMNWNHLEFHEPWYYPFADTLPVRPVHMDQMCNMARLLSRGIPFSRIDFYEMNSNPFFGEITFFPTSGMGGFSPERYDSIVGSMICLPKANRVDK